MINLNLLFLIAAITGGTVTTRIIPRYDGLLMELTSDAEITDSVTVTGYFVNVRPGNRVVMPEAYLPFWVYGWEPDTDSCGFTVELTDAVDSLDYSLSEDGKVLLLFFRAAEPLVFPELSWNGPPDEPVYIDSSLAYSDSSIIAALELGQQSPWLDDFDCIVIDPGHGGRDPGAVGPAGTFEKDRALEIALLVRDILNIRRPELEIIMTRNTDCYVSLGARTRFANAMKADLFISIHCNAAVNSSANGFETFFLSRARSDDSRAVEMLENSVIEYDEGYNAVDHGFPEDALSFLLADIAQNIYLERSSSLAVAIQESIAESFTGSSNRGVKQAGFYVLRGALMPSVLVEIAFISNPGEERMLQSLDFRLASAEAIVDAVLTFAEQQ
ncbi:MAG: N-acetylmuramoyl-L-alanine amidase [Candidatus Aegiribacteria sp.]|nr:N-acetylmuramoyl-L-alanine amidase [Candidatus Aegiribacteria sp.]